jgi:succinate dehydrogenase / fumarate reductase, membrane anchor subunit
VNRDIPETMARNVRGEQMSIVSWLTQRLTGVLLVVFLLTHLVIAHFVAPDSATGELSAGGIASRLQSNWFWVLDVGLLVLAIYHGLNGVLRVVVSAGHVSGRLYYVLLGLFWVVGIALTYWGVLVFRALLG